MDKGFNSDFKKLTDAVTAGRNIASGLITPEIREVMTNGQLEQLKDNLHVSSPKEVAKIMDKLKSIKI